MTAQAAFAEAVEQMARRATGADVWTSRAVFWAAVRAGPELLGLPWNQACERWSRLWVVASEEHLPPIPGAAQIGAPPNVVAVEQNLEQMRAIVGAHRRKTIHAKGGN